MPRTQRPRVPSASSTSLDSPFSFQALVDFDATKSLLRSRSDCFLESKRSQDKERQRKILDESTVWDIQPPDFRLQLYQPKPVKRNSRAAMLKNYNEEDWRLQHSDRRRERVVFERVPLPKILQNDSGKSRNFVTSFRVPDSHASKIMFVKEGKFNPGSYKTPGPHMFRGDDFRPLIPPSHYGKPEFETFYEHDPQGLKAKSQGLRVLCEAYRDLQMQSPDGYQKQMISYKAPDPKWDAQLMLPQGAYRKHHSAPSALMHQIEKQLPWCPDRDKIEPIMRPDIYDYKTKDWIAVTGHSPEEATRI
ncbi:uncharacterized protein LOC5521353 [Nematostella vectensis]|uniref:uncharacterized protein LOC5521353 n=1 Tax=Nematostella vectensis TaxID=45351 RepID=UPI0020776714|nr:uncharacterized protein LOC5521353 [Nematostella vectensis]